ncbi:hypothetical protein CTEN210_00877 [Chaetoceros tenuissimus]|uniref:Fe2OG dioxygenase domain-containing protein n=1 Tax=Chaetoceros tenuissimus TaxID=426638 RepID=A0AAD3GZC9_9STRA|nr:hypothetical protein CTEN210_00877 [Chaetoceros tenuissimus]
MRVIHVLVLSSFANLSCSPSPMTNSNAVEAFSTIRRHNFGKTTRHGLHYLSPTTNLGYIDTMEKIEAEDSFGPPTYLKDQECMIHSSYQRISISEKKEIEFSVSKLSSAPHIYHFKGLLSHGECIDLMNAAENVELTQQENAAIIDGESQGNILITSSLRSKCIVSWLNNVSNGKSDVLTIPRELGRVTGNILLTNEAKKNGWCEPLQLVHYMGNGGKNDLHHDGLRRGVTVLYYLNGVGNTWFPFANEDKISSRNDIRNRNDALQLVEKYGMKPGTHGVLIAGKNSQILNPKLANGDIDQKHIIEINQGDAIAFYNYKTVNGEVVRDWNSIHTALPTTEEEGEKFIANHWMHCDTFDKNWTKRS